MKEIIIDGASMNTRENMLYRGIGMVSANNSSRLLLDYKAEKPEIYDRLLRYIFGDKGVGVNHLKIEMGSDIGAVDKPLFSRAKRLLLSLITVIFQYQRNKKGLLT